jgi:hypothetical protein
MNTPPEMLRDVKPPLSPATQVLAEALTEDRRDQIATVSRKHI